MFGLFGKKKTEADFILLNQQLERKLQAQDRDIEDLTRAKKDLKNLNGVLEETRSELQAKIAELEEELANLKKKSTVKLKNPISKGTKNEFAEFEAQAREMSDSQKMYAAVVVAKKVGGRKYVAEATTVGEMRDIIKQVREGKLIVVGK